MHWIADRTDEVHRSLGIGNDNEIKSTLFKHNTCRHNQLARNVT